MFYHSEKKANQNRDRHFNLTRLLWWKGAGDTDCITTERLYQCVPCKRNVWMAASVGAVPTTQGTQPSWLHLLTFILLFLETLTQWNVTCWQFYSGIFLCVQSTPDSLPHGNCPPDTNPEELPAALLQDRPERAHHYRNNPKTPESLLLGNQTVGSAGRRRMVQCQATLQGEYGTTPVFAAVDAEPTKTEWRLRCRTGLQRSHTFRHSSIFTHPFCVLTCILCSPA